MRGIRCVDAVHRRSTPAGNSSYRFLNEALDPARQTAVHVLAAIVTDDRAGQIFDHEHRGFIDHGVSRGRLGCALRRTFIEAKIKALDR